MTDGPRKLRVYKLTAYVIDYDDRGPDETISVMENCNRYVRPTIDRTYESVEVEYTDQHPINITATMHTALRDLFSESADA